MLCKDPGSWTAHLGATCVLPEGFSLHATSLEFFPREKPSAKPYQMRMSLIRAQDPCRSFGALFTRNAFPGAPVLVGRSRLDSPSVQAILVNNRISNVGSPTGVDDSLALCAEAGRLMGMDAGAVFPSSTGIIGWSLPVDAMTAALPRLVAEESRTDVPGFARAIMTTDSYPKAFSVSVGEGTILGFAKGAGMIEPHMATMLVFLLTDLDMDRDVLRRSLSGAVEKSFNCISVDSDQSTSDSCFLLSSARKPGVSEDVFAEALGRVCTRLATHVVRNGEGTAHVIRATVTGFGSHGLNRDVGKAVVNSPLVKTAVYGNDPNVGRIVSSLGDFLGNRGLALDASRLRITLGDAEVFSKGAFRIVEGLEERLSALLKDAWQDPALAGFPHQDRFVDIGITLAPAAGASGDSAASGAVVWGSDLGYEYVKENADYRS